MDTDAIFARLRSSPFRARFHLNAADREYAAAHGMDAVRRHARDLVRRRLAPALIPNDGRQTPMRGHPVFTAQHACACCCRGCLAKWHRIPRGRELSDAEQEFVVGLIMAWIERECAGAGITPRPAKPGQLFLPGMGPIPKDGKQRST